MPRDEAIKFFKAKGEHYKAEIFWNKVMNRIIEKMGQ